MRLSVCLSQKIAHLPLVPPSLRGSSVIWSGHSCYETSSLFSLSSDDSSSLAIPMRGRAPSEDTLEMGQATSHSALGLVGGCLVACGATLEHSRCCEGYFLFGGNLHAPQVVCSVCSVWLPVR